MSTILRHMVWPYCEFGMQGLKCVARGSLEMQDPTNRQKFAIWAPSLNFVDLYLRN